MKLPSDQRYALVTGSGSGLGRAFALRLAKNGWHVACADVDMPSAQQTLAGMIAVGGRGQTELLDVANPDDWQSLCEKLQGQWPRLDLLVNNAGICASGEIGQAPLEDYRQLIDVNLLGVLHGCHTMVPWLKQTASGGHIVNISSIAGVLSVPAMGAYNITKAGVIALSETLYAELHGTGIGVTVVIPGFFPTRLIDCGRFTTEMQRFAAQRYTQQATITAEEVVDRTLRAMRQRRLYVVVGRRAGWLWRLKRVAPACLLRLLGKSYRRQLLKFEAGD